MRVGSPLSPRAWQLPVKRNVTELVSQVLSAPFQDRTERIQWRCCASERCISGCSRQPSFVSGGRLYSVIPREETCSSDSTLNMTDAREINQERQQIKTKRIRTDNNAFYDFQNRPPGNFAPLACSTKRTVVFITATLCRSALLARLGRKKKKCPASRRRHASIINQ